MRNRALVAALLALLLLTASPAAAHTGFESSSPAEGATLDDPLAEITLTFSGEASPAGEGFVILDPAGMVRPPDEIETTDNRTWTLRFDEPLAGGVVGVRWSVAAPDAHPIEGSFSFTIAASTPTTTAAPSTTTLALAEPTPSSVASAPPSTAEPGAPSQPSVLASTEAAAEPNVDSVDLNDFLDTKSDRASGVSNAAAVARALNLVGVVGAVGGAIFAALVLRGNRDEIRAVLRLVRISGAMVVTGAILEGSTQVATLASSWSALTSASAIGDALWTPFGFAVAFRLMGGALVLSRTKSQFCPAVGRADHVATTKQLSSVGAGGRASLTGLSLHGRSPNGPLVHDGDETWNSPASAGALLGAVLLVLSFAFDGHTVSEGPRALHALVNAIHVVAAAVWAGGVVLLAFVLNRRHRRGGDNRALQLALRFSVVATIALVAAGAGGLALTLLILDSVSQIWSTPWGRLLAAKAVLVAVATACGVYNHRVLIPEMERRELRSRAAGRFRTVVTVEAVALLAVAAVTALLVASSAA